MVQTLRAVAPSITLANETQLLSKQNEIKASVLLDYCAFCRAIWQTACKCIELGRRDARKNIFPRGY